MIFAAKVCEPTYKCIKGVVKLDKKYGLSAIPTQERKFSKLVYRCNVHVR